MVIDECFRDNLPFQELSRKKPFQELCVNLNLQELPMGKYIVCGEAHKI